MEYIENTIMQTMDELFMNDIEWNNQEKKRSFAKWATTLLLHAQKDEQKQSTHIYELTPSEL